MVYGPCIQSCVAILVTFFMFAWTCAILMQDVSLKNVLLILPFNSSFSMYGTRVFSKVEGKSRFDPRTFLVHSLALIPRNYSCRRHYTLITLLLLSMNLVVFAHTKKTIEENAFFQWLEHFDSSFLNFFQLYDTRQIELCIIFQMWPYQRYMCYRIGHFLLSPFLKIS